MVNTADDSEYWKERIPAEQWGGTVWIFRCSRGKLDGKLAYIRMQMHVYIYIYDTCV